MVAAKYLSFITLTMGVLAANEAEKKRIETIIERGRKEMGNRTFTFLDKRLGVNALSSLLLEFTGNEFEECVAEYRASRSDPTKRWENDREQWDKYQCRMRAAEKAILEWDCEHCHKIHNVTKLCAQRKALKKAKCYELLKTIDSWACHMCTEEFTAAKIKFMEKEIKKNEKELEKELENYMKMEDCVADFEKDLFEEQTKNLYSAEFYLKQYEQCVQWYTEQLEAATDVDDEKLTARLETFAKRKELIENAIPAMRAKKEKKDRAAVKRQRQMLKAQMKRAGRGELSRHEIHRLEEQMRASRHLYGSPSSDSSFLEGEI